MYRILIIEDDLTIAEVLKKHLEKWDYEARTVKDFQNILEDFREFNPHLVLVDIILPFFNGFYWCTQIRKLSSVPIVFLSSAADNMNIVMAMNMGGDEFIEKPFDLNVVTAKVQALLRRAYAFQGQVNMIEHKGVMLNVSDATVVYQGQKLELTKNEYKILKLLLENAGRIVARDEIMMKLWESDSYIDDNTLTVNVTRLRKKLEGAGLKEFILTKKGIGYLIES